MMPLSWYDTSPVSSADLSTLTYTADGNRTIKHISQADDKIKTHRNGDTTLTLLGLRWAQLLEGSLVTVPTTFL